MDLIDRSNDLNGQYLFLFPAVQGQDPVSGNGPDRFLVFIIVFIYSFGFGIFGFRRQEAFFKGQVPDPLTVLRVVGDLLRDNIHGHGKGGLHAVDAVFGIHEFFRLFLRRDRGLRGPQVQGQGLQSFFTGDHGSGAAFGLIWSVEILQSYRCFRRFDLRPEFFGQLALLFDGRQDRLPAFFQGTQVTKPFIQVSKHLVIQGPVGFLAVSGNKGNGIAFVDQADDGFRLPDFDVQFLCEFF